MLPALVIPLLGMATGTATTVLTDVYGAIDNLIKGRYGSIGDALDGVIGGQGDSFVSCMSEALCEGASAFSPMRPIKAIYELIRSFGEFAQGQYLDGLVHGFGAITGFKAGKHLVSRLAKANDLDEAAELAKKPLGVMAKRGGAAAGYAYQSFVDPFLEIFGSTRTIAQNSNRILGFAAAG
jgi:hypothetical protein